MLPSIENRPLPQPRLLPSKGLVVDEDEKDLK